MTDINLTYEDGLRLSELQGQLAQLNYQASHWMATHVAEIILIACVAILVMCIALVWLHVSNDCCIAHAWRCGDDHNPELRHVILELRLEYIGVIIIGVVLFIVLEYALYTASMNDIAMQQANVQAQIDTIMLKYA